MKKTILTILTCFIAVLVFAQEVKKEPVKQDTLFVLTMKDLKEYATMIDADVDSKDATKRLIAYIEQRGRIIPQQPADKPKPIKP